MNLTPCDRLRQPTASVKHTIAIEIVNLREHFLNIMTPPIEICEVIWGVPLVQTAWDENEDILLYLCTDIHLRWCL